MHGENGQSHEVSARSCEGTDRDAWHWAKCPLAKGRLGSKALCPLRLSRPLERGLPTPWHLEAYPITSIDNVLSCGPMKGGSSMVPAMWKRHSCYLQLLSRLYRHVVPSQHQSQTGPRGDRVNGAESKVIRAVDACDECWYSQMKRKKYYHFECQS